jgi:hypothetical protein
MTPFTASVILFSGVVVVLAFVMNYKVSTEMRRSADDILSDMDEIHLPPPPRDVQS